MLIQHVGCIGKFRGGTLEHELSGGENVDVVGDRQRGYQPHADYGKGDKDAAGERSVPLPYRHALRPERRQHHNRQREDQDDRTLRQYAKAGRQAMQPPPAPVAGGTADDGE